MLTDYERYQLEWMIEHGHSLKEFVQSLDSVFDNLSDKYDPNVMDSIDNLPDAYEIWERDYGFHGEVFSNEEEYRNEDATLVIARIKTELATNNAAYYNPETGDLIVSYLNGYDDPTVEVFSSRTNDLYHFTAQLTPDDIEYGETTHELAGQFARHVATYHSVDELSSSGYLDNANLLDVSSTEKLFKTGLAIASAEGSDIDLLVKRDIEEGRTVYALDRGITIASYLDDAENPRIEVSHYTPYELASLINARMAPDASDIRDVLADPNRPRAFDHDVASFGSMTEFLASRYSSPTSISQKWLLLHGDRLEPSIALLDVKQTDNVREWYALAFPSDELAVGISPSLTFDDAIAAVPTGDGFYTALGETADSLLRERIFEELCNRYGYTYDEVYDSWLHEIPLPSHVSQQPEKIAIAAGYRFNLVDAREATAIDLKGCGTVVTVDGHDYDVMKGATYEDSHKVDDLLDAHGDKPISDYRKRPQSMSLKQVEKESRSASAKLAEENGGTDDPDGKAER